jgi:hypothetical protein
VVSLVASPAIARLPRSVRRGTPRHGAGRPGMQCPHDVGGPAMASSGRRPLTPRLWIRRASGCRVGNSRQIWDSSRDGAPASPARKWSVWPYRWVYGP